MQPKKWLSFITMLGLSFMLLFGSIQLIPAQAAPGVSSPPDQELPPVAQFTPNVVLVPAYRVMGSPGFRLTITGQTFDKSYRVDWTGPDAVVTTLAVRSFSTTRLVVQVPASLLVNPGYATVSVINPADSSVIGEAIFAIRYPIPILTRFSRPSARIYSPDFTLTLYGRGFVAGVTTVHWGGVEVPATFISRTRMTIAVNSAAMLTTAGPVEVRLTNPTPGGGTSARTFTVLNPRPTLTAFTPASGVAGGPDFTLAVTGTNFVASSVVRWNGVALPTTFVSPTQLNAGVTAAQIASPGQARITVFNSRPGGGVSATRIFKYVANPAPQYVLVGWNDLGMHCYNRDFSDLAVLPPYNNLWAQVIERGDPPKIVTQGINVRYSFPENTYSVGKSNFWTYAQQLFNLPAPLPDNIGLTGKGLSGNMDASGDHFVAEGIPLTEYNDTDWSTRQPFQKAQVEAVDGGGAVLASLTVVAPVSTEMRCDYCHADGMQESITTGKVETNILTLHDLKNQDDYPAGHTGALMNRRPVLCAECHSSNALGAAGVAGLPSLSEAMHGQHKDKMGTRTGTDQCYSCHPGPQTKCLRDTMSAEGMVCQDCHGSMDKVATNPSPWLNEPRCDTCHDGITQNNVLYRHSTGHGGIYCEACHDSTHAIAPSSQPNDGIKFIQLQGRAGPLSKCTVCHINQPSGPGPHGNSGD